MAYARSATYPYPRDLKEVKDVEEYMKKLYASLLENDSRGEYLRDRATDIDLKQLFVRPEWYGAEANGTHDDTVAVKAAAVYASANGIPLVFSEGTYLISPTAGSYAVTIALTSGIKIVGSGAGVTTIKIKDSAGAWPILLGAIGPTDLSGLDVSGITFNCNISNNNHASDPSAASATSGQWVIWAGYGDNIRVHGCEFTDCSSIQVIYIGASNGAVYDVWIENNNFNNIGSTDTTYAFDSSIIYTHANNCSVCGNTMSATNVIADGNRTAIEVHADYGQIVSGNIIYDFSKGMNITGAARNDTKGTIIANNYIYNCRRGIHLWSTPWPTYHTSGYGFDGLEIVGNVIEIGDASDFGATAGASVPLAGIEFAQNGASEMDITNVRIENNIITAAIDDGSYIQSSDSRGIGWKSAASKTLSNAVIRNNTVVNFPLSGIKLECLITNAEINDNTLINCGNTQDAAVAATSIYRSPISIISATISQLGINRNRILETNATTRSSYGIYIFQNTGLTQSGICLLDNDLVATGSGFTNQVYMNNDGGTAQPYLRGVIRSFAPTSAANQKYALGSRVYDPIDGHLFTINSNQYTWNEDTDAIGTLTATALTTNGITLGAGGSRTILGGDTTHYQAFGGGSSLANGAYFAAFGADAGGNGVAIVDFGTSTADVAATYFDVIYRKTTGTTSVLRIWSGGNLDIGGSTTWGSTTKSIGHYTGVAPAGNLTDGYLQYSADSVAGNAAPHFRTEAGHIVKLFSGEAIADADAGTIVAQFNTLLARLRANGTILT